MVVPNPLPARGARMTTATDPTDTTTPTTSPSRPLTTSAAVDAAFPKLDDEDFAALYPLAMCQEYADGETVFRAGDADIDLYVVESGQRRDPESGRGRRDHHDAHAGRVRRGHRSADAPAGDRDGGGAGRTRLLRVPGARLRELLNRVPRLSEKLIVAFQQRRELLATGGRAGAARWSGPGTCRDTTVVREFLHKNFVPFTWYDSASAEGRAALAAWGSPTKSPVGRVRRRAAAAQPDACASWRTARACGAIARTRSVDLAVVGAGPAGMTAAVYAASEGLSTHGAGPPGPGRAGGRVVEDRELHRLPRRRCPGTELATRGVLQMLKFGARMVGAGDGRAARAGQRPSDSHAAGPGLRRDASQARAVLVAAGVRWRKLDAAGRRAVRAAGHVLRVHVRRGDAARGAGRGGGRRGQLRGAGGDVPGGVLPRAAGSHAGPQASWGRGCRTTSSGPDPGDGEHRRARGRGDRRGAGRRGGWRRHRGLKGRGESASKRADAGRSAAVFVFIGAEPAVPGCRAGLARDDHGLHADRRATR